MRHIGGSIVEGVAPRDLHGLAGEPDELPDCLELAILPAEALQLESQCRSRNGCQSTAKSRPETTARPLFDHPSCKRQSLAGDRLKHAGNGPADRRVHRIADDTVRFPDEVSENVIELFLVGDFQQCDRLLHFLIFVEYPTLRPAVEFLNGSGVELHLRRVLGQRIGKGAHASELHRFWCGHLPGPSCRTIHSLDRSTAMHVPFKKPRNQRALRKTLAKLASDCRT